MRFLVCIKQVVDASKVEVDPATGRLKRNNANSIMNPLDLHALEAAFELREQTGGTVSMGPNQATNALKECLAIAADKAYLVSDRAFGGSDTLATSYTLVNAIRTLEAFDVILCGQESIDSNTAQVGPEMAGMLGIPDVSHAIGNLSINGNVIIVKRQMNDGAEVVEMKTPCLITTGKELNKPRYPSIKGLLAKDTAEIHRITSADIEADPARLGIKGSPTQVRKVRPVKPMKKENLKISGKTAEESAAILAEALHKIQVI